MPLRGHQLGQRFYGLPRSGASNTYFQAIVFQRVLHGCLGTPNATIASCFSPSHLSEYPPTILQAISNANVTKVTQRSRSQTRDSRNCQLKKCCVELLVYVVKKTDIPSTHKRPGLFNAHGMNSMNLHTCAGSKHRFDCVLSYIRPQRYATKRRDATHFNSRFPKSNGNNQKPASVML